MKLDFARMRKHNLKERLQNEQLEHYYSTLREPIRQQTYEDDLFVKTYYEFEEPVETGH